MIKDRGTVDVTVVGVCRPVTCVDWVPPRGASIRDIGPVSCLELRAEKPQGKCSDGVGRKARGQWIGQSSHSHWWAL